MGADAVPRLRQPVHDGATPLQSLRSTIVLPLLWPAIFASLRIMFATSILNALSAAMLVGTTIAIVLAVFALKVFRRGQRGFAVEDFARLEI